SLVLGIILQIVGFEENERIEGTLLGIGGIFVASMVIWMWRTAKNIRRHMETRMDDIVTENQSRRAAFGLLAFTFFMVAREGIETVIFLAAATLGESNIFAFIGGLLGIAMAVLFAIFFIRGSLRLNLNRFFNVTTIVLLILAARLIGGSIHEFAEVGILPMSRSVMQVLGFLVRDRASSLLMMGLITVPIIMVLWDFRQANKATPAIDGTAAEQRKARASQRMQKTWQLSLIGTTLVIVVAIASQAFAPSPFLDPAPQPVTAVGDRIEISTAGWAPEALQKFVTSIGGTEVRFLAVKLKDGDIATSVDACQICGAKGYMQEKNGNIVICKVCNAPIPMNSIGQGGGCNPLPLPSSMSGNTLSIPLKGLQSQVERFQKEE
ncbi:MAG TPA: Fe-S-containing protein, partial [Dehalococcoidales bacterium]|nr:Fe-S-containing protein [Dehalococcoidales bacterium]